MIDIILTSAMAAEYTGWLGMWRLILSENIQSTSNVLFIRVL